MLRTGCDRAVNDPSGGRDADRPVGGRGSLLFRSQTGWPQAPQTCPSGRDRVTSVNNLTSGSHTLADRQAGLAQTLTAGGSGLAQAKSGAMGLIDQVVQAQAQTLAYSNTFLLQKPKGGGAI